MASPTLASFKSEQTYPMWRRVLFNVIYASLARLFLLRSDVACIAP